MVNYGNGKIYKLVSDNNPELVYIGSTTKKYLSQRLTEHVNQERLYMRGVKVSKLTSFQVIEAGNYNIVLLELFPCSCKDELHKRERWYIETLECVNKYKPGLNVNENRPEYDAKYRADNKEKIKEYQKEYNKNRYQKNKEHLQQSHDCECGGKYTTINKKRHERSNKHVQYINQQAQEVN